MYSKIKNIQIIVSLMKQHGVRHIVLSAGTRHVPIAHSVENDPFFKCYSVVDERSAGYFALGLAKELREPVAIACTSSTATLPSLIFGRKSAETFSARKSMTLSLYSVLVASKAFLMALAILVMSNSTI